MFSSIVRARGGETAFEADRVYALNGRLRYGVEEADLLIDERAR